MAIDIVNAFFAKHYPINHRAPEFWRDPADFKQCTFGLSFQPGGKLDTQLFPDMVFEDGTVLTVQAHYGAMSTPRDDYAPRYSHVEVIATIGAEPLLEPYLMPGSEISMEVMTYAYVPVAVVEQIIERHGGLKGSGQESLL